MTLGLYAAWNVAREGSLEITVDGVTVSITTGHVAHAEMSGEGIVSFATVLYSALLGVSAGWTVGFDLATSRYTITRGGAPFTLSYPGSPASSRMQSILGNVPTVSLATSAVGTLTPKYAMRPAMQCVSNWTGIASDDATERRVSDSGKSYAVGPSTVPRASSWEHTQEPKSSIHLDDSPVGAIDTWESFWRHAGRYQEPILMTWPHFVSGANQWPIFTLAKPDFSARTHSLMQSDWDALWRIRIEAENVRMVGIP